jgi:hypothetical protein
VVALPAALERDDPLPVVDDAGKLVGVVSSRERGAAVTPNGSQRRRSEAGCRKAAPRRLTRFRKLSRLSRNQTG